MGGILQDDFCFLLCEFFFCNHIFHIRCIFRANGLAANTADDTVMPPCFNPARESLTAFIVECQAALRFDLEALSCYGPRGAVFETAVAPAAALHNRTPVKGNIFTFGIC